MTRPVARSEIAQAAPEPSLSSLAREALSANSGDTHAATSALTERLRKDAKLLRSVIEQVVLAAVETRVEHSMRDKRRQIVAATAFQGRAGTAAMANAVSNALLDMPLAGGLKLRLAEKADVLKQAQVYEKQADDMSHKGRWLRKIAALVKEGQRVGDVLTEQRALKLWRETN